ncbi:putative Thioesterase domain-containing protein [Seiridium cardinale]
MGSILKEQIALRQTTPDTYSISWHQDWTLGFTLHGGCVAAAIHHAIATHVTTVPKLVAQKQLDILKLHLEFLRSCDRCESTITIVPLKIGAGISTFQLQLLQKGQIKVLALATTINFDQPLGPTVPTSWSLYPPPKPKPDFDRVLAHQPEENWLPNRMAGEVVPFTRRVLGLNPRGGFLVDGLCDEWKCFDGDERMDATYLTMMVDTIPSMSDTLLRNGGLYDAHASYQKMADWAEQNPGVPTPMTNSLAELRSSATFNATVSMEIEFKRRIPEEGLRFILTRATTKMLEAGRMAVDITLCSEEMQLVCAARQLILVVEAQRKFRGVEREAKI